MSKIQNISSQVGRSPAPNLTSIGGSRDLHHAVSSFLAKDDKNAFSCANRQICSNSKNPYRGHVQHTDRTAHLELHKNVYNSFASKVKKWSRRIFAPLTVPLSFVVSICLGTLLAPVRFYQDARKGENPSGRLAAVVIAAAKTLFVAPVLESTLKSIPKGLKFGWNLGGFLGYLPFKSSNRSTYQQKTAEIFRQYLDIDKAPGRYPDDWDFDTLEHFEKDVLESATKLPTTWSAFVDFITANDLCGDDEFIDRSDSTIDDLD